MKIKIALLYSALSLGLIAPALAVDSGTKDPGKEAAKRPPEWAGLFGDAPLPLVWQSASAASDKIAAALADKKLEGIPDWAETIHLASHALQSQAKVDDADRQADIVDAFRLSARLADDITAAAWAGDVTKTNAAYQRVKLALAIAERNLAKEVVKASPETVRFAKKERREQTEIKK